MTTPNELRCRRLPTRAEVADRLGVPERNVGTVYGPSGALDGFVDVTIAHQLHRLAVIVDPAADWLAPPRPPVRVIVPEAVRRRREAEAYAAAEARRRGEVEAKHYQALAHLGGLVASANVTERGGCRPAWLIGAERVDAERARRGTTTPVSAVTASALGLLDVPGPTPPLRPTRPLRVSRAQTGGVEVEGRPVTASSRPVAAGRPALRRPHHTANCVCSWTATAGVVCTCGAGR